MRRTKIVCTLGPATQDRVPQLIAAGMDVARVNFSHGSDADHAASFEAARRAAAEVGKAVAVLADLSGPKVRLGEFEGGQARLEPGRRFVLGVDRPGDPSGAPISYPELCNDLVEGDRILLADGAASLTVTACDDVIETEIVRGGVIRSRAGVNVPSQRLSLPAVTEKDRDDLARAIELGADFVAQSFVRRAKDVRELRDEMGDASIPVVAKIETRAAVEDFDAIAEEADAVMVARGDLGVEIPFEEIPVIQKDLVRRALSAGVPIIVATQMLESMTRAPRPTRAEASDVANAVLDGADALLLSAETAVGEYPVEAVEAAGRIAETAERDGTDYLAEGQRETPHSDPAGIARACATLSHSDPRVEAVACFTRTGRTAALLSSARPRVPILAFSPSAEVSRLLSLRRGVLPDVCGVPEDTDAMVGMLDASLRKRGFEPGSVVILVASTPVGRAHTNFLKVHTVAAAGSRV